MKKTLALSKSIVVTNDKETSNSNMPNQYARVKYIAKGGDVTKQNTYQQSKVKACMCSIWIRLSIHYDIMINIAF
jgi:hypothetical protein